MKYLNRIELGEFIYKYFNVYKSDIRRVSYIEFDDVIEYLINDHYLFCINK